jgi:hypothetical protein
MKVSTIDKSKKAVGLGQVYVLSKGQVIRPPTVIVGKVESESFISVLYLTSIIFPLNFDEFHASLKYGS